MENYDVVVIGSGVTGSWISYYLSKKDVSVAVLEKESDVCLGTSKANSAIVHAGYDPDSGTLMAKLNVRGNELIHSLYKKMSIPFKEIGSLVISTREEEDKIIDSLYARGVFNGVPGLRILSGDEARKMEINLTTECRRALYAPSAGICSPFELTLAPLECALNNGVVLKRNFEVKSAVKKGDRFIINNKVSARVVINAAGLYADEVASIFGDDEYHIHPRIGEYFLLDHSSSGIVNHVIFQTPTKKGKGILVTPTVDGNILSGPTSVDINDKEFRETTDSGQDEVLREALRSIPSLSIKDTITQFSGSRAVSSTGDFVLGFSSKVSNLYNALGICSPGLTASPAIGEYVVSELTSKGVITDKDKDNFSSERKVIRMNELSFEERAEMIKKNPLYGRIICRCEGISEGEIVSSIHSPCGAVDLDGVKRRVRAGMGRCQGGFCSPRVMEILSRELSLPYEKITKRGGGSYMVVKKKGEEK